MIQQKAPEFTADAVLPNGDGGELGSIRLIDYFAKNKWVLLLFYPLNFTFVCPTEIYAFNDRAAEFAALNCQILTISCDSPHSHLAWANTPRPDGGLGKNMMNIPMVSDFTKSIATSYGVLLPNGVPLRGLFLISPLGIVRQVTINDLPVGRSVDESLRLLQAFQFTDEHGEVCPANWQPGSATMKADPKLSNNYFKTVSNTPSTGSNDTTQLQLRSRTTASSGGADSSGLSKMVAGGAEAVSSALQWYTGLLKSSPLQTKAITSLLIGIVGEIFGTAIKTRQTNRPATVQEWVVATGRNLSVRRLACFGLYGYAITGPFFHWWYTTLEKITADLKAACLPDMSNSMSFIIKLAINQLCMTPPFLLFTLAYIQYFLSLDAKRTVDTIKKCFAVALFTNWKVWTVAQAINFSVVPVDYRVLFGNAVALWWNIYLSLVNTQG